MDEKRVFITGAGGCVGHYLMDELSPGKGFKFFLLTRDAQSFRFLYRNRPDVEIIQDNILNIDRHAGLLETMDYLVHLAASWGGKKVYDINVKHTLGMLSHLSPRVCRKVLYFSTASLLGEDNRLDPAAREWGTDYIKSKYLCLESLEGLDISGRITTIFPTVVLAPDPYFPLSHAAKELNKAWKHLKWARFLSMDGSFHFIHARDLARMVIYLLENPYPGSIIVPGNPAITVNECIERLCTVAHLKRGKSLDLTSLLSRVLPVILGKRMSPWDRYCLKKRHFRHRVTGPSDLGLSSPYRDLESCLTP